MSDLIALHWDRDHVTAYTPAKGHAGPAVTLAFGDVARADAAAIGRWLKQQLASHRIGGKRVAIVLPRSAAILRKLALPQVPDEELPDLVRMQAATKSATPLDRLRFDFVPLPSRGEGREALLITVPAKTVDDVLAAVRAAGLEPASIGLSPFATAAKLVGDEASCLIVAVHDQAVEITLVRDRAVLFSHVGDLPGGDLDEDRQWLTSEINRSVIAADHLAASAGISRVVLLGPGELLGPLTEPLASRFEARCDLVDRPEQLGLPASDASQLAPLVAAAGQLTTGTLPRIDLLNPRKRIEKPDRTRLRAGLAVGAAAAILFVAYGMTWLKRSDLEQERLFLTDEKSKLEGTLSAGQPLLKSHGTVEAWLKKEASWPDELVTLDSALPGTSRIDLSRLSLSPGSGTLIGSIEGQGFARSEADVRRLYDTLTSKGYQVVPTSTVDAGQDPEYPKRFDLKLNIPQRAEIASAEKLSADKQAKPTT
jgi:hypothetical protein